MKKLISLILVTLCASICLAYSVALMITGELGGSPIYQLAASGAKKAGEDLGIEVKIVEGGYNPSRWESNLLSLASTGKYDLLITFTEGMPNSVEKVAKMFPKQKIALVDGIAPKLPNVFSLAFDDEQMAFLAGYFAGLVLEEMETKSKKIGLLAGDIYNAMTEKMLPGYTKGAKLVDGNIEVVFSVVGSWGNPTKGGELAWAQFNQGVEIIFLIAGGSSIGAIEKAKELNKKVIGVDSNYISFAPDTILACTLKHNDLAVYDIIKRDYLKQLNYGEYEIWGIREGLIDFTFDDEHYMKNVSQNIREKMLIIFEELKVSQNIP